MTLDDLFGQDAAPAGGTMTLADLFAPPKIGGLAKPINVPAPIQSIAPDNSLPPDASEYEIRKYARQQELETGQPKSDMRVPLFADYQAETDPIKKREKLIRFQVHERQVGTSADEIAKTRDQMAETGATTEDQWYKEMHAAEQDNPWARFADLPIFRGPASGAADAASQIGETALRLLPGEGAPSQLADKLGRQRLEEGGRQAAIDKQQGKVPQYVAQIGKMFTEYNPGVAALTGGNSVWMQMGASGANDAYVKGKAAGLDDASLDGYALASGSAQAVFGYLGGKVAGGLTPQVLAGMRDKSVGVLRAYAGELGTNFGQLFTQVALDKYAGAGDGTITGEHLVDTLAATVLGRMAGQAIHGDSSSPEMTLAKGVTEKARAFVESKWPSRKKAQDAGVADVATTAKQRANVAAEARDVLTVDQFRAHLDVLAQDGGPITKDQARYLYYLTEARAKAIGESVGDYIAKRIKGFERTTRDALAQESGRTLPQNRRGEIQFLPEDGRAVIRAFESANFSTVLHELGHLFRRDLSGPDLAQAERWAGVKDGDWANNQAGEEKFARGFEKYMHDGVAPTPALKRLYDKLSGWMRNVYQTVQGTKLDVNIPDEMRQVYDRMFGAKEASGQNPDTPSSNVSGKVPVEDGIAQNPDTIRPEVAKPAEDLGQSAPPASSEKPPASDADVLAQNRGVSATSNKNATVDQERARRGLPPVMAPARQSNPEQWDAAMRHMDADPQWQDSLIKELDKKARPLTAEENMALLHRKNTLRLEHFDALEAFQEAQRSGDQQAIDDANLRANVAAANLDDFNEVSHKVGSEEGRSLQSRKAMVEEDFSLAKMEMEAKQAKGRDLTPDERQKLIDTQKELARLQALVDAHEAQKGTKERDNALDDALKNTQREGLKKPAKPEDPEAMKASALAGIKNKVAKDAAKEIKTDLDRLAKYFWQQGVRGRDDMVNALHEAIKDVMPKDWTIENTRDAYSGYGDFKPVSKDEMSTGLADIKTQLQQVAKVEALENQQPLKKTGIERRPLSDTARRLVKIVNELKKKFGVVTTDPASQLKSALDARKTYYKNRLADLKHEIETKQRTVKGTSEPPVDAELEGMLKEYNETKAEHEAIFGKSNLTDEQRLQQAIKAAKRSEERWNEKLAKAKAGDFSKPAVTKFKPNSFALMLIEARKNAAKAHYQELLDLANPKKTPEQRALQSLKARMASETVKLQEKLAKGDFTKTARKPVVLDAEGAQVKAKLDLVKKTWNEGLQADRWKNMSPWQKTKAYAGAGYDAARTLMTTGEFSVFLRQGKLSLMAHPVRTTKALAGAWRSLRSEQNALAAEHQMQSHPEYATAKQDRLFLAETGERLSKQEELFMGKWVGKIPGIAALERASRTFLNKVRFDTYLALRNSNLFENTPEGRRQIAMFINEVTGRGGLGPAEQAGVVLGRIGFSPRFTVSRFQAMLGHSMWGPGARKVIAAEYAKTLAGLGLYYTFASTYFGDDKDKKKGSIDWNPTSGAFGKVKVGNMMLDPLAGLGQATTLLARTGVAAKEAMTGKESKHEYGSWDEVMKRFMRSKLHPVPAAITNWLTHKKLDGTKSTLGGEALSMAGPITWGDMYDALRTQGFKDGAALSLLAFFGEGLQNYAKKKK